MRKLVSLLFCIILLCTLAVPAFAAELPGSNGSQVMPLLNEVVVATSSTNVWKYKPRVEVDNTLIAIAPAGSSFTYISYFVDSSGETWYQVRILSLGNAPGGDNLIGAYGYVSERTTEIQIW